jgi:hypothetical protein
VILEVPGDSMLADARSLALARTRPGALVRLHFTDRPDLAGYLLAAGARRAALAPVAGAPADGPVSLASLEAIWERGTAGRTASVIGMCLGAGAGTYVAVESCEVGSHCTAMILTNGALGGLVGWVLGSRVGSVIPRWHRRF